MCGVSSESAVNPGRPSRNSQSSSRKVMFAGLVEQHRGRGEQAGDQQQRRRALQPGSPRRRALALARCPACDTGCHRRQSTGSGSRPAEPDRLRIKPLWSAPGRLTWAPLRTGGGRSVSAHGNRDSHRIRRADRLGIRAPSGRAGTRRGRNRERHAQPVLRARGLDLAGDRRADLEPRRLPLARARHPRRRRGRAPVRRARRLDRGRRPHRRAAVARLGGARAADRLRRQRQRHPQPARGRARSTARTRRSSSARPTRSTATRRTGCRSRTSRRGSSCRSRTTTSRGSTPRCRSTSRPTRCSEPRRPPPTCWCRSTGATSRCRRSAFAAAA